MDRMLSVTHDFQAQSTSRLCMLNLSDLDTCLLRGVPGMSGGVVAFAIPDRLRQVRTRRYRAARTSSGQGIRLFPVPSLIHPNLLLGPQSGLPEQEMADNGRGEDSDPGKPSLPKLSLRLIPFLICTLAHLGVPYSCFSLTL